jgi:predicted phage terminase large subunit-like protein
VSDLIDKALQRALDARRGLFEPFKLPIELHPKQQLFVDCEAEETLFGGQSGGGKSFAALAKVLRYTHIAGYSGLVLRRRFTDLAMPGGLLDISHQWLSGTNAHFVGDLRTWRFPSGAVVAFGFIEAEKDKYRYQGSQYQQVIFDEITQQPEENYKFLFSRLRAPVGVDVPLQMGCTSNPGGEGHEWVKRRFLTEGEENGRVFIPSTLEDNPSIDADAYRRNLEKLSPVLRAQLLHGDWDVAPEGGMFERSWFITVQPDQVPRGIRWVRAWDRAASVPRKGASDPDWTCGVKIGQHKGVFYVADVARFRATSQGNAERIRRIAEIDTKATRIVLEEEPGSAGKDQVDFYRRKVLRGFNVKSIRPTGDKVDRAGPLASAVEAGNVLLVGGGLWISDFVDELVGFPFIGHDDQVDAAALGFSQASYEPFRTISFRIRDL